MASKSKNTNDPKWEGKATAKLRGPTADQVWSLLEDFFGFHRWLPSIDTCRPVDGGDGRLRYCAATLPPDSDGGQGLVRWCHEKLVDVDPKGRWLSYEIVDSNMGFKEYKSTIRVLPVNGGDEADGGGAGAGGCTIEWSFWGDPIQGLSCEDFVNYLDISLQGMAKNMETAILATF